MFSVIRTLIWTPLQVIQRKCATMRLRTTLILGDRSHLFTDIRHANILKYRGFDVAEIVAIMTSVQVVREPVVRTSGENRGTFTRRGSQIHVDLTLINNRRVLTPPPMPAPRSRPARQPWSRVWNPDLNRLHATRKPMILPHHPRPLIPFVASSSRGPRVGGTRTPPRRWRPSIPAGERYTS